jgi:hypothetical protein
MHPMNRLLMISLLAVAPLVAIALFPLQAYAEKPREAATLSTSLEAWVTLLEKDDLTTASKRWTRGAQAARAMEQWWPRLRACQQDYNYRRWLDQRPETDGPGAGGIGEATKFTVGGHSYGHLHVNWEKGDGGWKITGVWMCR